MSVADTLTIGRIALAPMFFVMFFLGFWRPESVVVSTAAAAGIFALMESSDLLDGYMARRTGRVSDVGKLMDPFADSVSRLTYFVCFAAAGIMPFWVLMVVIYRDVGVGFARILAHRRGVVMGARISGKLKAWIYGLTGVAGIVWIGGVRGLIPLGGADILSTIGRAAFFACAAVAVVSLIDYLIPALSDPR